MLIAIRLAGGPLHHSTTVGNGSLRLGLRPWQQQKPDIFKSSAIIGHVTTEANDGSTFFVIDFNCIFD